MKLLSHLRLGDKAQQSKPKTAEGRVKSSSECDGKHTHCGENPHSPQHEDSLALARDKDQRQTCTYLDTCFMTKRASQIPGETQ